ncbi:MAG: methane/ammonia monooxygenase subunit B [Gammaproteobacteria bacterium]|jgi:methane/ammonia monooxygenase subunit B
MKTSIESRSALAVFMLLLFFSNGAIAHGERAQQANLRMRTVNWYDIEMSQLKLAVGEELRLSGHLRPSKYWPEHIPSVTGKVFLNLGTSGPNFIREASSIDGVSMIQSTSLELGREYAFDIKLKARRPGRFHVHPILSVEGAGTMVGPGLWVEVTGSQDDFVNEVETMFGRKLDLETFNLDVIYTWHAIWFVIGGAWLFYWLRKRPLLIARMRLIEEAESKDGDGDDILTPRDRLVAIGFVVVTFLVIAVGYQWAESRHPITTPLRTAKVTVPKKDEPASNIAVTLDEAFYRIPGRSFQMSLTVQNNSNETLTVGEFSTANLRFVNPSVQTIAATDSHDLIAPDGLRVEGGAVPPGETRTLKVFAEDALWETQRLTQMINDPDSIIAGLLFFRGSDGGREVVEIGGSMLPVFN